MVLMKTEPKDGVYVINRVWFIDQTGDQKFRYVLYMQIGFHALWMLMLRNNQQMTNKCVNFGFGVIQIGLSMFLFVGIGNTENLVNDQGLMVDEDQSMGS
tara:strand:+ start:167 stop:466 length:300 start_codon:yes stop_codon:yes gene_type:complete